MRPLERLLDAREVAEILGIHYRSVHKLRRAGALPASAIAGTWRFDPQDIRDYIDKQKEQS